MEQILNIVVESIRDQYCDPNNIEINLDNTLGHLGFDSLDAIELVVALENKFKICIPDVNVELLDCSPNQIASYLYQLINGQKPTLGSQVGGKFCFNTTEQMLKSLSQEIFYDRKDISQTYYVTQENRHYRVNYSKNSGVRITPI